MKSILRFIGKRRAILLWGVLCTAVFAAVFALYGIDLRVIWYPLAFARRSQRDFFSGSCRRRERSTGNWNFSVRRRIWTGAACLSRRAGQRRTIRKSF